MPADDCIVQTKDISFGSVHTEDKIGINYSLIENPSDIIPGDWYWVRLRGGSDYAKVQQAGETEGDVFLRSDGHRHWIKGPIFDEKEIRGPVQMPDGWS